MPESVEDHLRARCRFYDGERMTNPYDITSSVPEDRAVEILKFHLWDVEKSVMDDPGLWRERLILAKGGIPSEASEAAKAIYEFAVKVKLEILRSFGTDLIDTYRKFKETPSGL